MNLEFTNSKGQVVKFDSKLTLEDLAKAGIGIKLEPQEKPKDPDPKRYYHDPK